MLCAKCHSPIAGHAQLRDQKQEHNEKGQLTGSYHKKCYIVAQKAKREHLTPTAPTVYDMSQGKGRKNKDDLTPEEKEALRKRQTEIAEQRGLEERSEDWSDPRDPVTLEVEDLSDPDRIVHHVAESRLPVQVVAESRLPDEEE